jgi:hypothetical protein
MPVPVIVLLAIVGFIVYLCIGAVVGPLLARRTTIMSDSEAKSYVKYGTKTYEHTQDQVSYLIPFIMFWPIIVGAVSVAYLIKFILVGPIWLVLKISQYVVKAQLGEGEK